MVLGSLDAIVSYSSDFIEIGRQRRLEEAATKQHTASRFGFDGTASYDEDEERSLVGLTNVGFNHSR